MSHSYNLPAIPEALPILKKDGAFLRLRPSPMRTNVIDALIPSGTSLLFGLRKVCRDAGISYTTLRYAHVFIDGMPIPHDAWHTTLVREGQYVSVCIPLGKGGGKNPLTTILSLVVVVAAAWVGGWVAGLNIFAKGGMLAGWGAVASGFAAGAVMMGGMFLVNQIAGVSQPKLAAADNETAAKVWSIDGAQNRADPYGVVPLVLGFIRFAPRFAAQYYTVLSGNDQYVRYLYVVGMGNVQVSDPKIGDTSLWNFQGCDWRVHQNWQGSSFAWFNRAVSEESMSVLVKNSIGWTTRTTKADTSHIALFFTFNGLKRIDKEGKSYRVTVELEVRYRRVGTEGWLYYSGTRSTGGDQITVASQRNGGWGNFSIGITPDGSLSLNGGYTIATGKSLQNRTRYRDDSGEWFESTSYSVENLSPVNGFQGDLRWHRLGGNVIVTVGGGSVVAPVISFSGQTVTAQRRGVEFDVPDGQYEVSVRRVTPDSDKETTDQTVMDECTWTTLQSWRNRPAVIYQGRPLTLIEVQLKATEQLSGSVDEFNVYCQSVAPCWNGSQWDWQVTNNPASLALLVATTECTGKAASWNEMDMNSYADFYNWCQRWGWAYNAVQTSRTTAGELQHNIMGAGRGSYAMRNGHGVVWDDPDAPVVDILTPRNSWGFSAKKEFLSEPVQGLRMRFLNEWKDFQEDERVVYADGYNDSNATNVIEWEQDGVTNPDLIWMHGRLRLAEIRLRPEVYTTNVEAESLTWQRGNCIRSQHDVALWGMQSGRVVSRLFNDDGYIVSIDLDEYCTMEAGKSYGIRVSMPTNPDVYYSVQTIPGVSRTLVLSAPIPAISIAPDFEDLVVFGIAGRTDQKLKILSITPSEGLTAQVMLQDAAMNIYDALTGAIPPWDSNITAPTRYQRGKPNPPSILSIISDESVLGGGAGGLHVPRMLLSYAIPEQPKDTTISSILVYIKESYTDEPWRIVSEDISIDNSLYISEVKDGFYYDLKISVQSSVGINSDITIPIRHFVIGRTTRPTPVSSIYKNGNIIWWEHKDKHIDVIGYEVSMTMDIEDNFAYAKKLHDGYITEQEFNISKWIGSYRGVWVVAVDELGLKSEPKSIWIDLGYVPEENIVFSTYESSVGRGWPGKVTSGHIEDDEISSERFGSVLREGISPFITGVPFLLDPKGSSFTYETHFVIPDVGTAQFRIWPSLRAGAIRSIEYQEIQYVKPWLRKGVSPLVIGKNPFGEIGALEWKPFPDKIDVRSGQSFKIRITSTGNSVTIMPELTWIVDVPDAIPLSLEDVVLTEDKRLTVPVDYFRWIRDVKYTLQWRKGDTGITVLNVDKGVIMNGSVTEGPLTRIIDKDGKVVGGVIDATIYGARV